MSLLQLNTCMLILDKIWRIFIEGKYGSVHDIIGPRPMSHDQKQKTAFLLKDLPFSPQFLVPYHFLNRFEEI